MEDRLTSNAKLLLPTKEPPICRTVIRSLVDRRSEGGKMAENGGGNTGLALIVGGLVVLVALFFVFGGVDIFSGGGGSGPDVNVTVDAPAAPAPAN